MLTVQRIDQLRADLDHAPAALVDTREVLHLDQVVRERLPRRHGGRATCAGLLGVAQIDEVVPGVRPNIESVSRRYLVAHALAPSRALRSLAAGEGRAVVAERVSRDVRAVGVVPQVHAVAIDSDLVAGQRPNV